jgi:hypothetical protein
MRHLLAISLIAVALAPVIRAADEPPQTKTPRQRYQALFQEHRRAHESFMEAYQQAKTNEERQKLADEKYPKPQAYTGRFLAIAEEAPEDPAAVDALIWIVENGGQGRDDAQALEILTAKHAAHKRMNEIAPRLAHGVMPADATLLKAILEQNPDRAIKGKACLALGQFAKEQADLVQTAKEDQERAKYLRARFVAQGSTEEAVTKLLAQDPAALIKQAETFFERVERDFADVSDGRATLGKTAKGELYEIRNLALGKPAPEITGEDLDGKPMKLSDFKGKVVVLDFWGDW